MIFAQSAARLLLFCIFTVSGIAKIADRDGSRQAVLDFGVPLAFVVPFSMSLPVAEIAVAVALIPVASEWWGALSAEILLLFFIAGISFNLVRGRTPDCHCFGRLYSAPIGWSTFIRATLLLALACFVIWYGPTGGFDGINWFLSLTAAQHLVLGAIGLLFALLIIAISLNHWYAHLRSWMKAFKRGHTPGDAINQAMIGLLPGTPAPTFCLGDLSGQEQTLHSFSVRGKPVLLIFVDPECRSCNALLPQIARWQYMYASQLTIALLSRGSSEANLALNSQYGLTNLVLQGDREVALAYQAKITPAAVLINADDTIGSSLVLGAQAISDLITESEITSSATGPRLRPDLVIEKQDDGTTVRYLIIDRARVRYWQCGATQYKLLTLFTGELTPDEIVAQYIEQTRIRLRREQLDAVLHKLEELGFLAHDTLVRADRSSSPPAKTRRSFSWPHSLTKRWRLFPSQRLLGPLETYTRWLFSPGFFVLCALLSVITGWIVVHDGWTQGIVPIWLGLYLHPSLADWGQLTTALLLTAVVHESAHGLTLQHFGSQPGYYGMGISLKGGIFFYVEIGEIWRLNMRGQRIAVSLAGPLASLLMGAVGALAWWILPRSTGLSPWAAALMAAGVLTTLYNLIPFFRTDGYFVLSDWVQIPNLDRKAQAYLLQNLFRPLRRQPLPTPRLPVKQQLLLAGYGVFAWLTSLWLIVLMMGFFWWLVVTLAPHIFVR
jgi:hypothetical protein